MPMCIVKGCYSTSGREPGVKCHSVPSLKSNFKLRKEWLTKCERMDLIFTECTKVVCSKHFLPECYVKCQCAEFLYNRPQPEFNLIPGSIPTVFQIVSSSDTAMSSPIPLQEMDIPSNFQSLLPDDDMWQTCAVTDCHSSALKGGLSKQISMFPVWTSDNLKPHCKDAWTNNLEKGCGTQACICELHFEQHCFIKAEPGNKNTQKQLKHGSIPTIFHTIGALAAKRSYYDSINAKREATETIGGPNKITKVKTELVCTVIQTEKPSVSILGPMAKAEKPIHNSLRSTYQQLINTSHSLNNPLDLPSQAVTQLDTNQLVNISQSTHSPLVSTTLPITDTFDDSSKSVHSSMVNTSKQDINPKRMTLQPFQGQLFIDPKGVLYMASPTPNLSKPSLCVNVQSSSKLPETIAINVQSLDLHKQSFPATSSDQESEITINMIESTSDLQHQIQTLDTTIQKLSAFNVQPPSASLISSSSQTKVKVTPKGMNSDLDIKTPSPLNIQQMNVLETYQEELSEFEARAKMMTLELQNEIGEDIGINNLDDFTISDWNDAQKDESTCSTYTTKLSEKVLLEPKDILTVEDLKSLGYLTDKEQANIILNDHSYFDMNGKKGRPNNSLLENFISRCKNDPCELYSIEETTDTSAVSIGIQAELGSDIEHLSDGGMNDEIGLSTRQQTVTFTLGYPVPTCVYDVSKIDKAKLKDAITETFNKRFAKS